MFGRFSTPRRHNMADLLLDALARIAALPRAFDPDDDEDDEDDGPDLGEPVG